MESIAMLHVLFVIYVITAMMTSIIIRCKFFGKTLVMMPVLSIIATLSILTVYLIIFRNDVNYLGKIVGLMSMTNLIISIDPFRYLTKFRIIVILIILITVTYSDYKIQIANLETNSKYETAIYVNKTSNEVLFALNSNL